MGALYSGAQRVKKGTATSQRTDKSINESIDKIDNENKKKDRGARLSSTQDDFGSPTTSCRVSTTKTATATTTTTTLYKKNAKRNKLSVCVCCACVLIPSNLTESSLHLGASIGRSVLVNQEDGHTHQVFFFFLILFKFGTKYL